MTTKEIEQILMEHDFLDTENDNCPKKGFKHKTFEERLAQYGGNITICDFDWGEPKGKEIHL